MLSGHGERKEKHLKINYSEFLRSYREEKTDKGEVAAMHRKLAETLRRPGIHGKIRATYYNDGCVKVESDGEYFNVFCLMSGEWFSGSVGDEGYLQYGKRALGSLPECSKGDDHIVTYPAAQIKQKIQYGGKFL